MTNKKQKPKSPTHISVTIDFIRQFPNLDIDNNENHFRAALYALGFNLNNDLEKKFGATEIENVLVRCKDKPHLCRRTSILVGTMRNDYIYPDIHKNGLLDVDSSKPEMYCIDLPYDLPLIEKANTRKYVKIKNKEVTILDDISALEGIFIDGDDLVGGA